MAGASSPAQGRIPASGPLRILLQDNGQVKIHYAVAEDAVCGTRSYRDAAVGVDKGCTEVCTDSDGERHGKGLGDLLSAESGPRKDRGQKRG